MSKYLNLFHSDTVRFEKAKKKKDETLQIVLHWNARSSAQLRAYAFAASSEGLSETFFSCTFRQIMLGKYVNISQNSLMLPEEFEWKKASNLHSLVCSSVYARHREE